MSTLDAILYEAYSSNKPVLFCGDIAHKHGYIPTMVLRDLVRVFKKYPTVQVYAISGNHDQIAKSYLDAPVESIITVLSEILPNFHSLDFEVAEVGDYVIYGVPYLQRGDDFNTYLTGIQPYINTNRKNILLAHQTPTKLFNPFIPAQIDIDSELLNPFSFVFMGHIHKFQDFGNGRFMVGNPLIQDESDIGDSKGYLTLDNGVVTKHIIKTPLDDLAKKSVESKRALVMKDTSESKPIDVRFYSDNIYDKYNAFCSVNNFTKERTELGLNFL
jgi:DNA repair exonuclease SbcCD nuclease subunit